MAGCCDLSPGDGGHDRHLVALFERGLATVEEADVFLVDVDVDETADLSALLEEAIPQAGKLSLEVVDRGSDRVRVGLHLGGALRHRPEGCGNAHDNAHLALLSICLT